jgi:hypothetical protein
MKSEDDAHVLMPDSLARNVPTLYSTQNDDDPIARIKWFTPDSSWTWFVLEYDPADRICFGLVIGHERELGYFSLDEIEKLRGPLGLEVERDLYFQPQPITECG